MSNIKHTLKPIHPGADGAAAIPAEISCVFRFGKDKRHDPSIAYELLDELETDENDEQRADQPTLSTTAAYAAIMNIKSQLKLSSSLQVHSSDGSLISVFNTEAVPSASSTYTSLEPSFDLPIGDPSFIQHILDNTSLSTTLPDLDLESDLFKELPDGPLSFDPFTDFDPLMTIQELTNVPMEQSDDFPSSLPMHDETTTSSVYSPQSEDTEQEDTTPRAAKKAASAARKLARFGNKQVIKYSNEYHDRRLKNNEAVKKSRMKAKEKQKTGEFQMNKLTEENRLLNERVDLLMKELQVLRSLYKELKHDVPTQSAQAMAANNTQ